MKFKIAGLICAGVILIVTPVLAKPPVKSVDADGNVTYSYAPAAGAETITDMNLVPGPSSEAVAAAKKQADDTINKANKAQDKRQKTAKDQAKKKKSSTPKETDSTDRHDGGDLLPRRPLNPIARPPGNGAQHPDYSPPVDRPVTLPGRR